MYTCNNRVSIVNGKRAKTMMAKKGFEPGTSLVRSPAPNFPVKFLPCCFLRLYGIKPGRGPWGLTQYSRYSGV